jgi:hypothetical protein
MVVYGTSRTANSRTPVNAPALSLETGVTSKLIPIISLSEPPVLKDSSPRNFQHGKASEYF